MAHAVHDAARVGDLALEGGHVGGFGTKLPPLTGDTTAMCVRALWGRDSEQIDDEDAMQPTVDVRNRNATLPEYTVSRRLREKSADGTAQTLLKFNASRR